MNIGTPLSIECIKNCADLTTQITINTHIILWHVIARAFSGDSGGFSQTFIQSKAWIDNTVSQKNMDVVIYTWTTWTECSAISIHVSPALRDTATDLCDRSRFSLWISPTEFELVSFNNNHLNNARKSLVKLGLWLASFHPRQTQARLTQSRD